MYSGGLTLDQSLFVAVLVAVLVDVLARHRLPFAKVLEY